MNDKVRILVEKIVVPAALALALLLTGLWGASQAALAKTYQQSTADQY